MTNNVTPIKPKRKRLRYALIAIVAVIALSIAAAPGAFSDGAKAGFNDATTGK